MPIPTTARKMPRKRTADSPCLRTTLAFLKSLAPQRCATWTENPLQAPAVKPLMIQVLVIIRPMEAEGFAPRRPTIPASMYCISTEAD